MTRAVVPSAHAIDIVRVDRPAVHACGGAGRVQMRSDPAGFLSDLSEFGGIVLANRQDHAFAGFPAAIADIDHTRTTCPGEAMPGRDFHVGPGGLSGFVPINHAARILVADVDGQAIVVAIWAGSNSIRFEPIF